jgi:hypothetical protein
MNEKIRQATLEELIRGYQEDETGFVCLQCEERFMKGEVYPKGDRFLMAETAAREHVLADHPPIYEMLLEFDKKETGLTDKQKEVLRDFATGLTDKQIAGKQGIAHSTVRHQRFVFKERAQQAKMYLAIYNLVDQATQGRKQDEFLEIHEGAKMVDDRYIITKKEEDKVKKNFLISEVPLCMKAIPKGEKRKLVLLRLIVKEFEAEKRYSEKEINQILWAVYEDFVTLRRYLIEYGFMDRTTDCREYWVREGQI